MVLEPEKILDRRRLKRHVNAWRVIAVVAVAAAIAAATGRFELFEVGGHVALLEVHDVIFDDGGRLEAIGDLAGDDAAKAVVVHINSPGGTVVGGETLFNALRRLGEAKPVVAVIGDLGTSAAYMAALGTDRIFANAGSITGSIGVILQTTDVTGLLGKLGISAEAIKSAPLKGQPNPLEPLSPAARAATQALVDDAFELFASLVVDRRNMPLERVRSLADGRVYSGRQALEAGLIDAIGNLREAREWLEETHGVAAALPLRLVKDRRENEGVLDFLGDLFGKTLFSERLRLDGLISVWHPYSR
jgi:protease-4